MKKTTKKKVAPKKSAAKQYHSDDKSFLIIVAGGFLLILLFFFVISGQQKKAMVQQNAVRMAEEALSGKKVVVIKNNAFSPATMMVKIGDTVVFRNQDPVEQAVLSKDGSFKTETIFQGGFRSVTFTKPGEFTYYSNKYPSMQATITVE